MTLMHRKGSGDATLRIRLSGNILGWEPSIPLREGMKKTYDWISQQLTEENKTKKGINRFNK